MSKKKLGRIYVGPNRQTEEWEIFRSAEPPTEESHGHLYRYAIGPFRTMRGAEYMRTIGRHSPIGNTVAEAEKLAKLYEDTMKRKVEVLPEPPYRAAGVKPNGPLPDDPKQANEVRANWAGEALEVFAQRTGLRDDAEWMDLALIDLLTDLRHLAQQQDLDFETALSLSELHYSAELRGEDEEEGATQHGLDLL